MSRFTSFLKSLSQSSLSAEIGHTLFEKSIDGIIITDSTGKCRNVNGAACRILGYTRDELLHLSFSDLVPSHDSNVVADFDGGGAPADRAGDMVITRKDGSVLNVDLAVHALEDGTYVSLIRDVSSQKSVSKELNRLNGMYGTLSSISSVILHAENRDSLFRGICEVATRTVSFTHASVSLLDEAGETIRPKAWKYVGRDNPPFHVLSLDSHEFQVSLLNRALRSGKVVTSHALQNEDLPADWYDEAARRSLRSALAVPFVFGGNIAGVLTLAAAQEETFNERDLRILEAIGEHISYGLVKIKAEDMRREMERALLESEERYRSMFESTTIGLYRTTPDGRVLMANRALLQMLGYESLEELQKRDLQKEGFGPSYSRDDFISRVESEGNVLGLESGWTRKDGSIVYLRESARVIRDQEGNTLYYDGSIEDITDRKLVEQSIMDRVRMISDDTKAILAKLSEGLEE
jgi:PAS domain S-box-containing protein